MHYLTQRCVESFQHNSFVRCLQIVWEVSVLYDLSTTTTGYIKCICLSEALECAKIRLSQLASVRWRACHYRGWDESNDKNIGLISMALPLLNGCLLESTGHHQPWHRSRPGESVDQKSHAKFFWGKGQKHWAGGPSNLLRHIFFLLFLLNTST